MKHFMCHGRCGDYICKTYQETKERRLELMRAWGMLKVVQP